MEEESDGLSEPCLVGALSAAMMFRGTEQATNCNYKGHTEASRDQAIV